MPADTEDEEALHQQETVPVDNSATVAAAKKVEGGDATETAIAKEASPANGEGEKKKKKNKKRGHGSKKLPTHVLPAQDNSALRCLGDWKEVTTAQTSPPTVQIEKLFPKKSFPVGEVHEYTGSNAYRTTSEEMKEADKLIEEDVVNMREAAECHRQVRKYAQTIARPGIKMIDLCQAIEGKTRELLGCPPMGSDDPNFLAKGYGFPTGCSLNNVAAHYSPNYGDNTVLKEGDICKLDFGTQVGGRIADCAFTIAFDPKFDPLIEATKEGTRAGVNFAGIDARFSEMGEVIQEAIESYEFMERDGAEAIPIKAIENLSGHSLGKYQMHGGQGVPIVKNDEPGRMQEGEFYAIETFASTGRGYCVEEGECSHYMRTFDLDSHAASQQLRLKGARGLLHTINKYFSTLPWCRRWLDDCGATRHLLSLKSLIDNDVVVPYPPLVDVKGSYSSQSEHSIILRSTCKEVVTRGDDY
ncbi:Methionine aminopeptidase 2 [Perkinsus chesapeaki]|uniref:Methionine aminopeptidase 2 n=1 Tax=Perkinsus chesapeaki TaxID=330153 RepID=A0A7J6N2K1_PERCH|nr:Methionine aminopeptidase 2 [Perkinsus chesapeaki]